jgi:hypothetical protein
MATRVAETFTRHAMYLIQDTLKRLYALAGFVTVTKQLDARLWII